MLNACGEFSAGGHERLQRVALLFSVDALSSAARNRAELRPGRAKLDASKNYSRIGAGLIQSVVFEGERGHGGSDGGVFRH